MAGIFAGDDVGLADRLGSPIGDVSEIPDRGRDKLDKTGGIERVQGKICGKGAGKPGSPTIRKLRDEFVGDILRNDRKRAALTDLIAGIDKLDRFSDDEALTRAVDDIFASLAIDRLLRIDFVIAAVPVLVVATLSDALTGGGVFEMEIYIKIEAQLSGTKRVGADGTELAFPDLPDRADKDGIAIFTSRHLIGAVRLKFRQHGIGDETRETRLEGQVLERRHVDLFDPQVGARLQFAQLITRAAREKEPGKSEGE